MLSRLPQTMYLRYIFCLGDTVLLSYIIDFLDLVYEDIVKFSWMKILYLFKGLKLLRNRFVYRGLVWLNRRSIQLVCLCTHKKISLYVTFIMKLQVLQHTLLLNEPKESLIFFSRFQHTVFLFCILITSAPNNTK